MASKVRRISTATAALGYVLALSPSAVAQAPPAQPAAPPPASPSGQAGPPCVPECRYGYFCQQGSCISSCNPPCPSNQVCIDGNRCEFPPPMMAAPAPPQIYEPPPPVRKPFVERTHSLLAFHLGFDGNVEANSVETGLDPTLGLNLRVDVPVVRYLLLGPMFEFSAWRPDVSGETPSRNYFFDIDLFVRGRIPIETDKDSVAFQVWAGVPVGLTLSFLGEETGQTLEGFGLGWNIGLLFGGAVHFSRKFGMFAEIGWQQHKMSHEREVGSGDVDFTLTGASFNVGFVFGN
jgi:hypothetical protein